MAEKIEDIEFDVDKIKQLIIYDKEVATKFDNSRNFPKGLEFTLKDDGETLLIHFKKQSVSRKPKNLKPWEFVKDKKHNLTTLRPFEDPSTFYYQCDGFTYTPACQSMDFDNLPAR